MDNQTSSSTKIIVEPSLALDYLRMDNEVSMEVASVLSAGVWAEMDVTVECGPDV